MLWHRTRWQLLRRIDGRRLGPEWVCNLYSLNKKRDAVARFFRGSHNRTVSFEPTAAIFPKHVAPVVRCTADGEREIVTMSWGFMLLQKDLTWLA